MNLEHKIRQAAQRLFEANPESYLDSARVPCLTAIAEAAMDAVEAEIGDALEAGEEALAYEAAAEWWDGYPEKWRYNQ